MDDSDSPTVHIVSSAPKRVFTEAVSCGALYRYAEIDPVIVQPLAYHVDRRKSVDVLKSFLAKKDQKIEEECAWIKKNKVDCVLSDAAFLACKAANAAGIPSVLITNFTFDSVYSYLSIKFPKQSSSPLSSNSLSCPRLNLDSLLENEDEPIPPEELEPLVNELHEGYRCAELLILLPGNIPIPSFGVQPSLPSYLWADPERNTFHEEITSTLTLAFSTTSAAASTPLHPPIRFPISVNNQKALPRKIIQSPLIVRRPSKDAYTSEGRKRILDRVGIPTSLQGEDMKILVVSFGGQVFRKPSSRTPSRNGYSPREVERTSSAESARSTASRRSADSQTSKCSKESFVHVKAPVASLEHLWVPGAPPASKQPLSDRPANVGTDSEESEIESESEFESEPQFLPDDSWIVIVCGATGDPKATRSDSTDSTGSTGSSDAVGDVLLGKLGYGTTAECVDSATPLVYVPRPLFVEEHGLRVLIEGAGVGVEMPRGVYEGGMWRDYVREAWERGREGKVRRRVRGLREDMGESRSEEAEAIVRGLVEWVREWKRVDVDLALQRPRGGRQREVEHERVDG
ncbi:hypothetical protein EW145_g2601 [Phellinidium pouzarii]|uniref:Uncharacterized protein n=1 Tax=Phellinidium pouzarii TaxID=167371 RepID=A0A4S4LBR1_9AGAM|nr:hypothetical protein EW145_g2601 [Phellinidium pouzarii]